MVASQACLPPLVSTSPIGPLRSGGSNELWLHANSTDAQREIYNIRRQLQTLQDSRIGIDISSVSGQQVTIRSKIALGNAANYVFIAEAI